MVGINPANKVNFYLKININSFLVEKINGLIQVEKLTSSRAELKANNDQLGAKLRILTHYIQSRLTMKDESEMFEELYDIKSEH